MRLTLILLSLYAFMFQGFLGATAASLSAGDPGSPAICQTQNQSAAAQDDPGPLAPAKPHKHTGGGLCCAPCCRLLAITPPGGQRESSRAFQLVKPPRPSLVPIRAAAPRPHPHARGPPVPV